MTSIELENVIIEVNGNRLLNDISFKVENSEYIGLLGPSGEGPSVILKAIAGLLPLSSGRILIDGNDVTHTPPEDRHVGFVFEQFNLFPHMTVLNNLLFGPRMRREDIELKTRVAKEIISMVRLDGREEAISSELSGGMQQRVGVARAVTAGAKILLLDQPYRALDAKIRTEMRFEIREIVKELKLTAMHATHETEEAMITADRIAVFNKGNLEQIDTPENIFSKPNSLFVATFLAESNVYESFVESGLARIGKLNLNIGTNLKGKFWLVIRQQAVRLSIEKPTGNNVFKGKITTIRLLGEFIRFVINVGNHFKIISKELLAIRWKNPYQLMGKSIYVKIADSDIFAYPQEP